MPRLGEAEDMPLAPLRRFFEPPGTLSIKRTNALCLVTLSYVIEVRQLIIRVEATARNLPL
jgi:hypothetical protein